MRTMSRQMSRQPVPNLGDLVSAAFDEAKGLDPHTASELVSRVIADLLVRAGKERLLHALKAASPPLARVARPSGSRAHGRLVDTSARV